MSFVIFNTVWQFGLITQSFIINKRDSADPVAISLIAESLHIILFAGEIPHEITPVHQSHLIGEEPVEIIRIAGGFIPALFIPAQVEPVCIKFCMVLVITAIPDTWEELFHITLVIIRLFSTGGDIFFITFYIGHFPFFQRLVFYQVRIGVGGKMRSINQWRFSVLFTAEIVYQVDGIVHIVHVNRRIGIGADQCREIHEVTDHHECITPER